MTETTIAAQTPATPAQTALPHTFRFADNEEYGVRVTAAINAQLARTAGAIELLGNMIVTAYAQGVHDLMGYDSWTEYADAELSIEGFKPDAPARDLLVKMLREAGMQFADVATTVKASVRTVKTVAEKQGTTAKRVPTPATARQTKVARGAQMIAADKTVQTVKPADAATIAAMHKLIDQLDETALDGLAQYIATVRRQRNAATAKRAA